VSIPPVQTAESTGSFRPQPVGQCRGPGFHRADVRVGQTEDLRARAFAHSPVQPALRKGPNHLNLAWKRRYCFRSTGRRNPIQFCGHARQVPTSLVAPIGFNWQISITLVPGLATREVAVAALGTVYAMSSADSTVATQLTSVIAGHARRRFPCSPGTSSRRSAPALTNTAFVR
jgi:hypothetical protein